MKHGQRLLVSMVSTALFAALAPTPIVPITATAQTNGRPESVIFFNGQVVTMESRTPQAEALALIGDTIVAVGSNQRVLAMARRPGTQLIDLGGRALLPGFVDPHAHTLGRYDSLDERQQRVLAGGVTSIGQPGMNAEVLAGALLAIQTTDLRIRTSLYLGHNTKCDGPNEPEGWYLDHPPDHDPRKMLRVLGVKVFADAGKQRNFCGWAKMSVPLPEDFILETGATAPYGEILLSTETMTSTEAMTKVLVDAQAQGLQVVFHVRGDAVLDAVLDAIEAALDGGPNVYRHRIDHVDFIRPDQLARFGEVGALPVVRGRPNACVLENPDVFRGPSSILWLELLELLEEGVLSEEELNGSWLRVARSLIDANPGLPVAWHSDTGSGNVIRSMDKLYALVTKRQIHPITRDICYPPDWLAAESVSVEEALRMMTINAAYALFMEHKVGSLKPGKFADLIVLSENPLEVDPDSLPDIEVLVTMVGGKVELCKNGYGSLCPGSE